MSRESDHFDNRKPMRRIAEREAERARHRTAPLPPEQIPSRSLRPVTVCRRFWIDSRNGCIAIRDTTKDNDPTRQGLAPDMADVVWFRMGKRLDHECEHCGHKTNGEWIVPTSAEAEATLECARLNAINEPIAPDIIADMERETEMRGESREERMGGGL